MNSSKLSSVTQIKADTPSNKAKKRSDRGRFRQILIVYKPEHAEKFVYH